MKELLVSSRGGAVLLLLMVLLSARLPSSRAFGFPFGKSSQQQQQQRLGIYPPETEEIDDTRLPVEEDDDSLTLEEYEAFQNANANKNKNITNDTGEWDAMSSWGAALLRLRKEEEEIMREIGQDDEEEEDGYKVSGDSSADYPSDEPSSSLDTSEDTDSLPDSELIEMDVGTARELDNAVSSISARDLKDDMTVLPMSPFYTSQLVDTSTSYHQYDDMPLSRPEHYQDRVDRDKQLLAIGIAESMEDPSQWRRFLDEGGGIRPLLTTIRQAAHFCGATKGDYPSLLQDYDETFLAACRACRALRDLCAMDDHLRVVLTDELLRANRASDGALMQDFCALLLQDHHHPEVSHRYRRPTSNLFRLHGRKNRRESRRRCKLYVVQMLLAMAVASDDAIDTFRTTPNLKEAVLEVSSYALTQQTRRWLRYPGELWKNFKKTRRQRRNKRKRTSDENDNNDNDDQSSSSSSRPFIEAASVRDGLRGQIQGAANQLLAAIGHNQWVPKIPNQKGLRILCFDGGGTRGMSAISTLRGLTDAMGGMEVCDTFDIICGTSTGAIIAFLVGLRRETSQQANDRYNVLIEQIFGKSAFKLSTLFTTASYSEQPFVEVLYEILGDSIMLDSRADPAVPLVFAVSSVMTATPTYVTLFRNYNYASGESLPDHFVQDPDDSRRILGLMKPEYTERAPKSDWRRDFDMTSFITGTKLSKEGSRYYGSFRPLQREALRKSTAAPTIFKPVKVKDMLYCDGGIVASNPTAMGIHEAKTLFPHVPIELVVSIGTGGFTEERFSPKFGWDAIVGQIVNSACDGERIHHMLDDLVGQGNSKGSAGGDGLNYYRFNPTIGTPNDFPIDSKDPESLARLYELTSDYLQEPKQQESLKQIKDILDGKRGWRKLVPW